jgi:hypothetical protein
LRDLWDTKLNGARAPAWQEAAMQTYTFRWLDFLGKPIKTFDLDFIDDASAIESAIKRGHEFSIDVFQSGRRIARVKKGNADLYTPADRSSL